MQERVDLYTPLGLNDAAIRTFHSFGDEVFREFALELGRAGELRVLSPAEQVIFVREHLFSDLPLKRYRPAGDPLRHVRALLDLFGRARDDDISPEEYVAFAKKMADEAADDASRDEAEAQAELAATYAAYTRLKEREGVIDFGDQIALSLRVLRDHPGAARRLAERYRYRAARRAPPQPDGRRRRRPVDLRLAWRDPLELRCLPRGVPGREGRDARREPPLRAGVARRGLLAHHE